MIMTHVMWGAKSSSDVTRLDNFANLTELANVFTIVHES